MCVYCDRSCVATEPFISAVKYFQTVGQNNIYMIGFHANGYNPDRKTIIKAIVENSKFALKSLKNNIVN